MPTRAQRQPPASTADSTAPVEPGPILEETRHRWSGVEIALTREDITAPSDWRICRPCHTVIVHLEGGMDSLETTMEGHGGSRGAANPGEVWTIPAGVRYAATARGSTIGYAVVSLDPSFPVLPGERQARPVEPTAGLPDAFLHQSVRRLASLRDRTDDLSILLAHSLSHAVGVHVFQRGSPIPESSGRELKLSASEARRIRDHLIQNLSERVTLDDLARRFGLTPHQFLRAFNATFGTTPIQYLIGQRIREGRRLLRTTRLDLTTIALNTGFSSHAHFTHTFRKHLGLTPREYRRAAALEAPMNLPAIS
ncbi:MAG: helix-turn-helix transcriptional regulator [Verrucomicrobia bacterium]|nr:helix-turn-helix transcriptional regulator [Verrucomicrobiota bacterium]